MKWEKTITTAQEYEKTIAKLSKIFEADADSAEGMETEMLVTLIDKYERNRTRSPCPIPLKQSGKQWKEKDLRIKA